MKILVFYLALLLTFCTTNRLYSQSSTLSNVVVTKHIDGINRNIINIYKYKYIYENGEYTYKYYLATSPNYAIEREFSTISEKLYFELGDSLYLTKLIEDLNSFLNKSTILASSDMKEYLCHYKSSNKLTFYYIKENCSSKYLIQFPNTESIIDKVGLRGLSSINGITYTYNNLSDLVYVLKSSLKVEL